MKKIWNIAFALLLLLSQMHFSYQLHYCGGYLADSALGIVWTSPSCGMEQEAMEEDDQNSSLRFVAESCCSDEILLLFSEDDFQQNEVAQAHFSYCSVQETLPSYSAKLFSVRKNVIRLYIPPESIFDHQVQYQSFLI